MEDIREVTNKQELRKLLKEKNIQVNEYRIAVSAILFDEKNKWILLRRGPECGDEVDKLECIGGSVEMHENFVEALKREIEEEAGSDCNIEIKSFYDIHHDRAYSLRLQKNVDWIIISYICKYIGGELQVCEPTKNLGFSRYSLDEINERELSSSSKTTYNSIKNNWERILKLL